VLDRFGTRRNSFVKQFTILIIFTLSFLAFILAPMIALKLDANRLSADLKAANELLAELR